MKRHVRKTHQNLGDFVDVFATHVYAVDIQNLIPFVQQTWNSYEKATVQTAEEILNIKMSYLSTPFCWNEAATVRHLLVLNLLADRRYITFGVCVNQYFLVFYRCVSAYTGNNISNQSDIPYWLLFCLTGSQNEKAQRECVWHVMCVWSVSIRDKGKGHSM